MKLITLDPYNKEHEEMIKTSFEKKVFKNFMGISSLYRKEEYEEMKHKRNEILECLLEVDQSKIKNYCIFTGTKDNRFIHIGIENLSDKKFLEESIHYAFQILNAYTVTIFSDTDNSDLEKLGFESLGKENGITTYIKEKEMDLQVEKVR